MGEARRHEAQIYPLRAVLRGISPLIWRRVLYDLRLEATLPINPREQLVRQQLAEYLHDHRSCPCCQQLPAVKGYHSLRFRSLFGDMELRSPRW